MAKLTKSYRRGTAGSLARSHEMQRPVTQTSANTQSSGSSGPLGIFGSPWILVMIFAFMFLSRGAQPPAQANAAGAAPQSN